MLTAHAEKISPVDNSGRAPDAHPNKSGVIALVVAATGVVYGDIGTSPLYTMKTIFAREHGLALNDANLLGIVSLIIWGLTLIVSLKYVTLIMRADNHGEGGIMALLALALAAVKKKVRLHHLLMLAGLFGAALFYGDGVITPAISVLSAIEGLEVATPALKPYVLPLTVVVLIALYLVQHKGTAGIGKWFGPIMLLWFLALAIMGGINIVQKPDVLRAINPWYALRFVFNNRWVAFVALGSVVLAFTGAEALYADMGHFGKRPIRVAWSLIVFPSLALNYLGQGALLLTHPDAIANPFYQQLGPWSVYPLVVLSTVATIIASQATISGTFSMTHQAISLGFLPRLRVVHTSETAIGQVYIPLVNWIQLLAVLLAVLYFGSSDNLGAAYGIAVTGTMLITTILTFFVIRYRWNLNLALCWGATGFFLVIDIVLFSANTLKLVQGGWFPLLLGSILLIVMLTWEKGRELVYQNLEDLAISPDTFIDSLFLSPPIRVSGTAVYFRPATGGVPRAMLHNLIHNKIVHERVIFLSVFHDDVPVIPDSQRVTVKSLHHEFYELDVHYGFKEERNIPRVLALCREKGLPFELMDTSFFVSRQTLLPKANANMALWRQALFAMMFRNARDAADYYCLPANRVVELGAQVEL